MISSLTNLPRTSSTQAIMSGPWPAGTAVVTALARSGLCTNVIVTLGYCLLYASKIAFLASRYPPSQLCQIVIVPLRLRVVVVVLVVPPQATTNIATIATAATPIDLLHCFQANNVCFLLASLVSTLRDDRSEEHTSELQSQFH